MWHVPTWSQAVDGISMAFQTAYVGQKKLSRTYSLNGKRDKSNQLLKRVISILAADNFKYIELLNIYLDVIQVGLRELHSRQLIANKPDNICRQAFYYYWVLPLLESLNQKLDSEAPETLLLREIIALQKDYFTEGQTQSIDGYLNKRISVLLPRGSCSAFKHQLHKNRNRRFFSLNDDHHRALLKELSQELSVGKLSKQKVAQHIQQLCLLFKSGAVLRSVDKWLGGTPKQNIISRDQQQKSANKISQLADIPQFNAHHFQSLLSSEISIFWQLVDHEEVATDIEHRDAKYLTGAEIERIWPILLQKVVDDQLRYCPEDHYIEEIHEYCLDYAPNKYQPYLNGNAINDMKTLADRLLTNRVKHTEIEKIHHKIQQMVFFALKKMLVAMHDERQLGNYGVSLASTLIAKALSGGYRLTKNELTPLLNVLVENLSSDDRLFPMFDFFTPFGLREFSTPGMPMKDGQDKYKDDEAMIYGLALRLHNERIFYLYGNNTEHYYHLGYPFLKLERVLEKLFSCTNKVAEITPQKVALIFREKMIKRTSGEEGNPCWRFSDATPYFILRNLELHLQLTGLIRHNKVYLTPNIDRYYSMSKLEKRQVLKLLDPIAYQRDLKQWWMAKKSRRSSSSWYQVEDEYFLKLKYTGIIR